MTSSREDVTVIGRGAHIRGRITGGEDLEIHGHVDGEISVTGEVLVEAHGLVGASITGRRLVVRGAVRGDLDATDAVILEDGARVVGDVRAPRVSVAPGALVRGYVATGAAGAAHKAGDAKGRAARPAAPPKAVAPAAKTAPSQPRAVPAAAPSHAQVKTAPRGSSTIAGARPAAVKGPPSPVVPVLKKGTKGALHKKR